MKLRGLYQPKYLNMMSLEKLLKIKADLEGIISTLEMGKEFLEKGDTDRKEPIPNSLRIIKVLLKSLKAKPTQPLVAPLSVLSIWDKERILHDEDTISYAGYPIPGPNYARPQYKDGIEGFSNLLDFLVTKTPKAKQEATSMVPPSDETPQS